MKHEKLIGGLAVLALGTFGFAGCDNNFKDKPAAAVNAASAAAPGVGAELAKKVAQSVDKATAGLAGAWTFDASQSEVGFVGAKLTGKHEGTFKKVAAQVTVSESKVSALSVTIDTDSVESDNEKLTGHLKSPDFFDVQKFPQATFVSKSIVDKVGDGATHSITGDLTLHGVTKSLTFPASVQSDANSAKGVAEFTINRKDFGIVYPGKTDDLIKDDVLLKLKLAFKPSKVVEAAAAAGAAVDRAAQGTQAAAGAAAAQAGAAAAAAGSAAKAAGNDINKQVAEAADKANTALKEVTKAAEKATGTEVDKAAAALKAAGQAAKDAADKLAKPAASAK